MHIERRPVRFATVDQPGFGKVPEPFDYIGLAGTTSDFIADMIHAQVRGFAQIHQPDIASPAVAIDDAVEADFASYNPWRVFFVVSGTISA